MKAYAQALRADDVGQDALIVHTGGALTARQVFRRASVTRLGVATHNTVLWRRQKNEQKGTRGGEGRGKVNRLNEH